MANGEERDNVKKTFVPTREPSQPRFDWQTQPVIDEDIANQLRSNPMRARQAVSRGYAFPTRSPLLGGGRNGFSAVMSEPVLGFAKQQPKQQQEAGQQGITDKPPVFVSANDTLRQVGLRPMYATNDTMSYEESPLADINNNLTRTMNTQEGGVGGGDDDEDDNGLGAALDDDDLAEFSSPPVIEENNEHEDISLRGSKRTRDESNVHFQDTSTSTTPTGLPSPNTMAMPPPPPPGSGGTRQFVKRNLRPTQSVPTAMFGRDVESWKLDEIRKGLKDQPEF